MSLWLLLLVVAVAGAIGGLLNGLQINFRSQLDAGQVEATKDEPLKDTLETGALEKATPRKVGSILYNTVLGATAAALSWASYGPYALENIIAVPGAAGTQPQVYGLTLASLATALITGLGGARWLTNELDKRALGQAAVSASLTPPSEEKARLIGLAAPEQAAAIAAAPAGSVAEGAGIPGNGAQGLDKQDSTPQQTPSGG